MVLVLQDTLLLKVCMLAVICNQYSTNTPLQSKGVANNTERTALNSISFF